MLKRKNYLKNSGPPLWILKASCLVSVVVIVFLLADTYYKRFNEPDRILPGKQEPQIRSSKIIWTYIYLPSSGEVWEVREANIEFVGIMIRFEAIHPNGDTITIYVPQAEARIIQSPER